jgi:hypothetical protein
VHQSGFDDGLLVAGEMIVKSNIHATGRRPARICDLIGCPVWIGGEDFLHG